MNVKVIFKVFLLLVICILIQCAKKDQIAPSCNLIYPQDNSVVSGAIRIKAVAMDNKEVAYVEFFINNVRKGVDSIPTNSVYEYIWNASSESPGSKTISARAYDQAGNVGESPSITVTIEVLGPTYHFGEITTPQTWTKKQSPHIVIDSVIISALLTIEPGAFIQFSCSDTTDTLFPPDWRPRMVVSQQGDIIARANNNVPIIFTSSKQAPNPRDWEGIIFEPSGNIRTFFDNCIIEYANIGIELRARTISITNTLIQFCHNYGVRCQYGRFAQFYNNIITRNEDIPISITADAVYTLGANNYLRGNSFGSYNLADAVEVLGGYVIDNGTWRNQDVPYLINDVIYIIYDITLTIQNGCVLAFSNADAGIYMEGLLNASGVIFTSENALAYSAGSPGDWNGIYIDGGSIDLQNCIIEYGGSYEEAVIIIQNYQDYPSISINNCIIRYNDQSGISLDVQEVGGIHIANTRISNNNEYPVILYNAEYIRALGPGNNFSGNGNDFIYVLEGGEVMTSGIWYNCGVPYLVEGDIIIYEYWQNQPPTITIMPGVTMMFYSYCHLIVERGTLIADGSSAQIVFTNAEENGYWGGIVFQNETNDNLTRLNHCIIQYGGGSSPQYANIFCQSSNPRITNCEICYSAGWGVTLQGSSIIPDTLRRYNRFYNNASGDIRTLPKSLNVNSSIAQQKKPNEQYRKSINYVRKKD